MSGKLVVITGPSGVGKDSVIEKLIEKGLKFSWVITTTTRKKRKGESEGRPYYFVTLKDFEDLIRKKRLLEWAEVYGNYYGSTIREVKKRLSDSALVILKPDPVGARTIKSKFPDCLTIFIASPSLKILKNRLLKRATDSLEIIEKRLKKVKKEMEMSRDFDEIVVNNEGKLNETAEKVLTIINKYCKVDIKRKK